VEPTVYSQCGFDARFFSACRGAASAAPRMAENTNMIQIQTALEHRIFRIPARGFVQHVTNILSPVGDNGHGCGIDGREPGRIHAMKDSSVREHSCVAVVLVE